MEAEKLNDVPVENRDPENNVEEKTDEIISVIKNGEAADEIRKKYTFIFVLGGPGGGKSTQCARVSGEIGFIHLSSGDLLRKASECDPDNGEMIKKMIEKGESAPPELTMKILTEAMETSGNDKFILDGFPRDEEIRSAFEDATKTEPELVLLFDCSEEESKRRILNLRRNQGRADDNPETLRNRFRYFQEKTLRVVEHYESKGKVRKIDAGRPEDEVFLTLKNILSPLAMQSAAAEQGTVAEADACPEEIHDMTLNNILSPLAMQSAAAEQESVAEAEAFPEIHDLSLNNMAMQSAAAEQGTVAEADACPEEIHDMTLNNILIPLAMQSAAAEQESVTEAEAFPEEIHDDLEDFILNMKL